MYRQSLLGLGMTQAADFISKPLQFEEVHARAETHLKLGTYQTPGVHASPLLLAPSPQSGYDRVGTTIYDDTKGLADYELRRLPLRF